MICCCDGLQTYHYHLDTGKCHDPLRMRYSHHCKTPLDLDAMRAGADLLIGTHDFTQFSNESKERLKRNPVKTLERLDVLEAGPAAVRLEVRRMFGYMAVTEQQALMARCRLFGLSMQCGAYTSMGVTCSQHLLSAQ